MNHPIKPGDGIGNLIDLNESLYTVLNKFKRLESLNVVYSEKDYLNTPITVQVASLGINLVFKKDVLVLIEVCDHAKLAYVYNGVSLQNVMHLKVLYNKLFGPTYPGKLINNAYLLSYPGIALKFDVSAIKVDRSLSEEKLLSYLLGVADEIPCVRMFIYNGSSFGDFMETFKEKKEASTVSSLASNLGDAAGKFSLLFNATRRYIKIGLNQKEFLVTIGQTTQQDILNFLGPPDDYFNKFDSRLLIHNSFFKRITSNESNRIYKFHNYFQYGVDFLYDLNDGGKLRKVVLHNGTVIESSSFVRWNKCNYEIYLGNNSSVKNPFDPYDVKITSDMYFTQIPSEFFEGSQKTPIVLNRNESELLDNELDVISLDEVNQNWGQSKLYCSKNCIWEVLGNECISSVTIY